MTRTHRQRHESAYRAGGRACAREVLEDLLAITPPEVHGGLRKLVGRIVDRPKWRREDGADDTAIAPPGARETLRKGDV